MIGTGVVVVAGLAGLGAGRFGSWLLRRLRRGVQPPRWGCEVAVALTWAAVAVGTWAGTTPLWWTPVPSVLGWLAVLLTTCDLLASRLPDALTLSAYPVCGAVLVLVAYCGRQPGMVPSALFGAVVFAGGYACVSLVVPGSLGAGDVKLAGGLGIVVGAVSPVAVLLVMLVAALLTLAAAVALRRRSVPHGPSMLLPAWLVTVFPMLGPHGGW